MKLATYLLFFIVFVTPTHLTFSQDLTEIPLDVIPASAGNYANIDVQLSFTFGEPVSGALKNGESYLNQGFQQYQFGDILTSAKEEIIKEAKINIYPNPSNGNLILSSERDQIISVSVFNIQGKKVAMESGRAKTIKTDLSFLTPGLYLIQIELNSNKTLRTSFIKV